jgi:5-methylcytosine-specific restriction endonuclease McrA
MILPAVTQMTLTEFKLKFGNGKVIRCKKFNRKSCWAKHNVTKWHESVRKGWNINPLIFVHIDSCIEYAIQTGLDSDKRYFEEYKNEGYEFITIEGGNRTDATELMYDTEPDYHDKKVNIAVIENVSREEMHEGYVRLAHGVSPNPQERRTGIYGKVSDLVRKTSERLNVMWTKIDNVKQSRMGDDEMVAMIMNYATNKSFGPSLTNSDKKDYILDMMYRKNNYDSASFNHIINNLKSIFDSIKLHKDITKKLNKNVVYLLVMIIKLVKENNFKIENYTTFVKHWYDYYLQRNNSDDVLYLRGKAKFQCTFSHLISGLAMDNNQLKEMTNIIETEFIDYLKQHNAIVPYNDVEFTSDDKKNWIKQNKYKKEDNKDYVTVRTNTPDLLLLGDSIPEFTEITLAESHNGSEYELDHIIPKSKGGETTLRNAELTSKAYNRKKTDKLLVSIN